MESDDSDAKEGRVDNTNGEKITITVTSFEESPKLTGSPPLSIPMDFIGNQDKIISISFH